MPLTRSKILNRIQVEASKEDNSKRLQFLIGLALTAIVIFLFVLPSVTKISDLSVKNDELKRELEYLEETYSDYSKASSIYSEIIDYTSEFNKKVPTNPDPYYPISKVNEIAVLNNIVLDKVLLINKDNGVESYSAEISGNFTSIQNFLEQITKDSRYIRLSKISINTGNNRQNESSDRLSLKINFVTFYE